ncbi:MAG: hypothetical protein M0R06_06380, partial [Sphaerochaeta sp.]|nr:hypothetical protein [Sphaerochaeta sp.]
MQDAGGDKVDNAAAADLAADLFWNLYQSEPQPLETVPAERGVVRQLLDWVAQSPAYETSRQQTTGGILASAFSTALMHAELLRDETIQEALEKQADAEQKQREAEGLQKALQAAEGAGNAQMTQSLQKKATEAAQAATEAATAAAHALDGKLDSAGAQAARAAAIEAGKEAAKQADDVSSGWGPSGNDPRVIQDVASILETTKKLPHLSDPVK